MSLVCIASSAPSCCINLLKVHNLASQKISSSNSRFFIIHYEFSVGIIKSTCKHFRSKSPSFLQSARDSMASNNQIFSNGSLIWEDLELEDTEEMGSPWEGAIIYKRNPSISHVEYCTTLERFGLGNLSTEVSKSRASLMGLRVTKEVKDYPHGTPVQISIDVTRKKQKLQLDGIIKTVLTLPCKRCGESAAECVYSNFSILLTQEPIEEPEIIDTGMMFGEDKSRFVTASGEEEDDDEASIGWDDWLYFPPEEKEIDISKDIRDMIHVEITYNAICDPKCKGLCLKCGTNLNASRCNCSKEEAQGKGCSV